MITERRRIASRLGLTLAALSAFFSLGMLPGSAGAQVSALPLNFSDVAIFATNSARIDNGAQVTSGHVVVNSASSGPTLSPGVELRLGNNAHTPTGYAVVADSIQISNGAVVGGNAFFNTLSNSGTISGTQNTPLALPVFTPLPTFKSAPPGTLDVTVPNGTVQTLAAGNYRDIKVLNNATLRIDQGVTNVRSIAVSNGGKLLFLNLTSGPSEVRVAEQMTIGNGFVVGPVDSDPLKASKIVFYVASPATTTVAVETGNGGTLFANVYAPNGTLVLDNGTNAAGAFLAKNVDVQNGSHVALESFFAQQAPAITSANATAFTVGQAGTFTVTTTGFPQPSITRGGAALPSGVTFVDNGNGTGTLSGTPTAGTGGTYAITFTASNGVPPDAVQNFTLTVVKASQTITVTSTAPAGAKVGGPTYTVTATATSGLAVAFTIDATATAVCSLAGSTVSFIGAGTCVIDANQAGDTTYNAAPQVQQSFAVGKGGQTITFTSTAPAGAKVGGPTYTVTATATSGLVVAFTIDATATAVCSLAGSTVSFIGAGTCVIDANQAGNANYNAAPQVQQSFAVGKGDQTITFTSTAPSNALVGGPTYTVTATATSGLVVAFTIDATATAVCSLAGSTVSFIGAGTCVIDANQAGNANYNAALQVQQSFAVGKGGQTITFTSTAPSSALVGGPTYTVTATATSGLVVAFTIDATATAVCSLAGSTVSFIGAGTCVIDANQAGNANYNAAPQVQQSFAVTQPPTAVADGPYVTDANTTFSRATSDPDDLLDNDSLGFPLASLTSFGGGSLGGTVTSNPAGTTATFGTGGSLTVQSNGAFTFTPETGFTGAFTFQYRLTNAGGTSDATVTIHVRPKATADIFGEAVVGNVVVNTATGVLFSVLTNDVYNGTPNAVSSGFSSGGGTVTMNPTTGTFTYNPAAGFQGSDSFTYTVTDASGLTSAPATVSVVVSGMIWFVNNNAAACSSLCNGRLTNPFTTLQAFTSVNDGVGTHPGNGQNIFVYESATAYSFSTGTLLRTGQKLIGQDATATLAGIAGVTLPSGSALPAMNTGGNATTIGSTVTLAANSTVRGLTISTGTSTGLDGSAVSGVSVSEVNAVTITGTAVNLSGVGGTVSLLSVTASGGSNGIKLQNTTGSFTVTGDGADTSVGGNASGGTIANTLGTDGTTAGIGVYLDNAQNVTLRRMTINGIHQNYGIRGLNVSGFALEYSTVSGLLGTSVAADEGSVSFGTRVGTTGLTGTATITNSVIRDGVEDNLSVFNHSGTLTLTISGSTFRNSNALSGNDGVIVEAHGTANVSVDVKNSTFTANRGDHFQATADDGAVLDVKFGTNGANTLSGGHASPLGQGITISSGVFSGQVTFNVSNNVINGAIDSPINVNKGGGAGTFSGHIHNNAVGTSGSANSGTTGNKDAIRAVTNGAGSFTAVISDNVLRQVAGNGIFGISRDGSSNLDLTIVNNSLAEPNPGNNAIRIEAGAVSGDSGDVCADIGGAGTAANTVSGDWGAAIGADEIRLRHQLSTTTVFRLPGFVGVSPTGVPAYLTGRNSGFPPGTATATIAGTGAYTGGGPCVQPVP